MNPIILTSAYLPPVQYFTKLYAAPCVIEERCEHYVKQTYRNRCIIAGPDGRLPLTIPVEHRATEGRPLTRDIRISDHGNWRHLHWTALVSAYENSPYFFYYADDFRPFYEQKYKYLVDFNEALCAKVCELLDMKPEIRVTAAYYDPASAETDGTGGLKTKAGVAADDYRERIRPKADFTEDPDFLPAPYYQVFSARTGFLPNLSIADLLFNMGPESRIVLRASISHGKTNPMSQ